jgi:hypothetical protein
MTTYRTAQAECLACEEESDMVVMEWPPKVFVCPHCFTPLVLVSYADDLAAYKLGKLPPSQ